MNNTETTKPKPEKVGVLLVHGIGEQCQFEHLEGEARNIATTLRKLAAKSNEERVIARLHNLVNNHNGKNLQEIIKAAVNKVSEEEIKTKLKILIDKIPELTKFEFAELAAKTLAERAQIVQVTINSLPSAAFGAKQETWQERDRSPVMVEVYDYDYTKEGIIRLVQIYFHQVWWADLDEPTSLWSELQFWGWGLSLWTINGKFKAGLPGYNKRMEPPNNVQQTKKNNNNVLEDHNNKNLGFWARVRLFWVSLVILLILPVLSLLNFVLRGLLAFNIPRPDILGQFIGDVKLFQQDKRIGKGPLQDLGLPPRVTLRRRMIRGMVEMALRRYDRWYILAHSQGTVLAFNGIMETAQSLPNYLTEELWYRCIDQLLIRKANNLEEALKPDERKTMQPPFPSWRNKEYILDRRELFKNLRGLLTYGSPLSKFAALWPVIVPINNDHDVFSQEFQWLNIYDPTDPVAGKTKPFQSNKNPSQPHRAEPIDKAYKADRFHLPSHLEYLTFSRDDRPRLVDLVANWLLEDHLAITQEGLLVKNETGTQSTAKQTNSIWLSPVLAQVYELARLAIWMFAALLIGGLLGVLISEAINRFVPQLASYPQAVSNFIQIIKVDLPAWLKWSVVTVYLLAAFSTIGAFIRGTLFLYVGLGLGALTTVVLTAIPLEIQEKILSIILTAFFEGIFYIILAAIVVFIAGIIGIPVRAIFSNIEKR
ncbi:hypothetical protein [Chroococcidiopsis sp. CCMEE 29]|uniref:hypothetical protein n=1 Tax=Chroococcidiopsis sp. CCMEE 29 TaxID=155894 RepID=UPI002020047C|nr:hypothetical protein [Chroococcidiopsis sp. CCMEE 29]